MPETLLWKLVPPIRAFRQHGEEQLQDLTALRSQIIDGDVTISLVPP
jgi:hypothetical protein